ncbi:MAG: GerMN domain-containing protein [Patescibacteria group bacterium]
MKNKYATLVFAVVLGVALIGVLIYAQVMRKVSVSQKYADEIVVQNPEEDQTVKSPLEVRGKARGSWFFEANIRVDILDANNKVITQTNGMAEGEWMTADFVPFKSTVVFKTPDTKTGILRIKNDNPSGLPENEKSFDVPIVFGEEETASMDDPRTMKLNIFFGSSKFDPQGERCDMTYSISRSIPKTTSVAKTSFRELLLGPTALEKKEGYFTSIPDGVKLQGISVENGIAKIDFSKELDLVGGSCRVTAIRSQITETLKQFPTIQNVVISIGGRTEDILQP